MEGVSKENNQRIKTQSKKRRKYGKLLTKELLTFTYIYIFQIIGIKIMTQKFKFTSAVEKFVVVFMVEDELMFAEIRNFPTEKDLWEAEILFNPGLINNIVVIATEEDYTWDKSKLTKEQRDIILQDVRNTYFKKNVNPPIRPISPDSLMCSCIGSDIKQEIIASNLSNELKQAFSSIRTCSSPIKIEDFIQIFHSEASKIEFSSRPIIYKVRDVVTKKLGITDEEFNGVRSPPPSGGGLP